jgi:hypothetical protein
LRRVLPLKGDVTPFPIELAFYPPDIILRLSWRQ